MAPLSALDRHSPAGCGCAVATGVDEPPKRADTLSQLALHSSKAHKMSIMYLFMLPLLSIVVDGFALSRVSTLDNSKLTRAQCRLCSLGRLLTDATATHAM